MGDERDEPGGFRVSDRRRFAASGEPRDDGPPELEGADTAATPETTADPGTPPEVTFMTFVLGLSTQALMHLGEIADPAQGSVAPDLPASKQVIDILGVLKDKTSGNLTDDETGLLDAVLYDLRMRYVARVERAATDSRKESS